MVDARFDSLAGVFDRAAGAVRRFPTRSASTESDGVTTWTLWADVGVDGERLETSADEDDCGEGARRHCR